MNSNPNHEPEPITEDLQPDLATMQFFEDDGRRYRIYLTRGGHIACDHFEPATREWVHLPLRDISEEEIRAILATRYSHSDEEIARAVDAARRT